MLNLKRFAALVALLVMGAQSVDAQVLFGPAAITGGYIKGADVTGAMVTPNGGTRTTLGAALAAGGGGVVVPTAPLLSGNGATLGAVTAISAVPISGSTGAFTTVASTLGYTDTVTPNGTTGLNTLGTLTFGGLPIQNGGSSGGVINNQMTYNAPTTAPIRNRYFSDTMTSTGSTTTIDEGFFLARTLQSGTFTSEINGYHNVMNVAVGATHTGSIEMFEASSLVSGSANLIMDLDALISTAVGGSITTANGITAFLTNNGTTGTWNGLSCPGNGGNAPTAANNCIANYDPLQLIMTKGHLRFFGQVQPTATGCGTSPAFGGYSSNSQGEVTEGAGATGCTIVFATYDPWLTTLAPHCDVFSLNGSALVSTTPTTTTLTLVNLASGTTTNPKYKWSCFQ